MPENSRLKSVWEREAKRLENGETDHETMGIVLSFCNMVFQKDPEFLDKEGYITEGGKKVIQQTFKDTADALSATGSSEGFYKVFFDGNFAYLLEGEVLFESFVSTVIELLNADSYNPYGDGTEKGRNRHNQAKK